MRKVKGTVKRLIALGLAGMLFAASYPGTVYAADIEGRVPDDVLSEEAEAEDPAEEMPVTEILSEMSESSDTSGISSSDDDPVTEQSADDHTVIVDSVHENAVPERLQNGTALNPDDFTYKVLFPNAEWIPVGSINGKPVCVLEAELDNKTTAQPGDTVKARFLVRAGLEAESYDSVHLYDPDATAEENAGANAENVEGEGAYVYWSDEYPRIRLTHVYETGTPIGKRLNPYWLHHVCSVDSTNDGHDEEKYQLWTIGTGEITGIQDKNGNTIKYSGDADWEFLKDPIFRGFHLSHAMTDFMTVNFLPYGPGARVAFLPGVQSGRDNTPAWIGDSRNTSGTWDEIMVYHSLENGIGFSYWPQGQQVADKVIVRYRKRKSVTDFTYEDGFIECTDFVLKTNSTIAHVTDLSLDILSEENFPAGAEIYEVELVYGTGKIDIVDVTSIPEFTFMKVTDMHKALKQAEYYRGIHPERVVSIRLTEDESFDSSGTPYTINANGAGRDSSGLMIDLNGKNLTIAGTLLTNGAPIKNGNIVLAENAVLAAGSAEGGEQLDIDTLTAGSGSKLTIGGYVNTGSGASAKPTIARIRTIGEADHTLSEMSIGGNAEVHLSNEGYINGLKMQGSTGYPAVLSLHGADVTADTVNAGPYAAIGMDYRTDENGERVLDDQNDPIRAKLSTASLTVGTETVFSGAGDVVVSSLTLNKNILTIGKEGQEDRTGFSAGRVTGTSGGILAYHADARLKNMSIAGSALSVRGDDSEIIFDALTGGNTATLTVGDDETNDGGAPLHSIRVICIGEDSTTTLKEMTVRKSGYLRIGEISYSGVEDGLPVGVQTVPAALALATLNMSPDAELSVSPDSTLTCSSTATLYSGSRLFISGTAGFKNIALKTASGRDGLSVDLVTDEVKGSTAGRISIDGTITSDSYKDADDKVHQGIILLKHPKWSGTPDWDKDIAGYENGAVLLYSKNNNNADFFRAYYGTEQSGYSEQRTVYDTGMDGAYYKLILRTVVLYSHTWDPAAEDLPGYAGQPVTGFTAEKMFPEVEALFAWLTETDGEGNAVNLDAEGKTVYRVLLEAPYASAQAIRIPATQNGIIIEGSDRNAQVRVDLPAFYSGSRVWLGNLDLKLEDKLEVAVERDGNGQTAQGDDLILSGTRLEAGTIEGTLLSVHGLCGSESVIVADTMEPERITVYADAEFRCEVAGAGGITTAGLCLYPGAKLQAPDGLCVTGTARLYDDAGICADGKKAQGRISFKDIEIIASGADPLTNGSYAKMPGICMADGTRLDVSGNILPLVLKENGTVPMELNGSGRYPMSLHISRYDTDAGAGGSTESAPKGFAAKEEILRMHGKSAEELNSGMVDRGLFLIAGSNGMDVGNYRFRVAEDEADACRLTIVAIEVYAMPATAPQYSSLQGGVRLGDFLTYDDAVNYIAAVAVAGQKYYVSLPIDTKIAGTDLAIPAAGAQIVICGDPEAARATILNASNVKTAVRLANNLMFQNVEVQFADGTEIDLNGRTLYFCDADVKNLAGIKGRGDLVLFAENLNDGGDDILDKENNGFRKLGVSNGIAATNLTVTNYNILLNDGNTDHSGKLSITNDVRAYNSIISGLCNGSSVTGNLYLDQSEYRIGAPEYTGTTPPGVSFGVGRDVILRNSRITNGDGDIDAGDALRYGAPVSFTAGGSVYMKHSVIAVSGDITLKKNLCTASSDNLILYGAGTGNKFTVSGTASDAVIPDGVNRDPRDEAHHELYRTVNWDWTDTIAPAGAGEEIEPVALSSTGRTGHFIVHGNAVNVRRLSVEGAESTGIIEYDYGHLTGIADCYKNQSMTPIVVTRSDPLYFRIGGCTGAWRENGKDYSVCGLKASGAYLVADPMPDMAVVLYLSDSIPGGGETAIGSYAALQDALDAIGARNVRTASYAIGIRDLHATGIWDENGGFVGVEDPVFPDRAARITIRDEDSDENDKMGLYLRNKLTLNTNVTIRGLEVVPKGTEILNSFHGAVTVDLRGFVLTLDNCNLVCFDGGMTKDPEKIEGEGRAYFRSITGNGEAKTSGFVIRYDTHPQNAAVWVYGDIKGVGTLTLENATLCATGNVSAGRITSAGEGYSALYTMAEVKEDAGSESGYTVTPELSVSGPVTATDDSKLYLAQMVRKDGEVKYDALPYGLQAGIGSGIAVPVMKNGTVSGRVYYAFAELSQIREPTAVKGASQKPGVFIRSLVGREKYLCYTANHAVPYTLSVNAQAIIGANDWASIRSEIETINNKEADYDVILADAEGDDGMINRQAELLTMPKATALRSLKITTGSDYEEDDEWKNTIPTWNYIGDAITLTCDTVFENVHLAGYKSAEISVENRLSVTNIKTNKPTLTMKIGGAYAMRVEGNMIIDSRQLFIDGGSKGTLEFEWGGNNGDRHGYLRTTDTPDRRYLGEGAADFTCIGIRGKITKLAEMRFSRGGIARLSGYVSKAYGDTATLNAAAVSPAEFSSKDLAMASNSLYTNGKVTVEKLNMEGASDIGDDPDGGRVAVISVTDLHISGNGMVRAKNLGVSNLTVSDGASVDVTDLTVKTKLTAPADAAYTEAVSTISAAAKFEIRDLEVHSDNLLLRTMYKSDTATNLKITGTVNTDEIVTVNGAETKLHHTVRMAAGDPAGIGAPAGDFSIDLLNDAGKTRISLVTTVKGTADQFVAATCATGNTRVYDNKDHPDDYQTFKSGSIIYAYRGDQIEIALLAVADPGEGNLPQLDGYHTGGKLNADRLIAYYPTYTDAVAAIEARKDAAQGYALVLLKAEVKIPDNKGIPAPAKAKFIHICALSNESVLSYTGNSIFGTDVYFQHLKLENRNISTPGRGNFYGYNITVNGDHILAFDGVTTVTGEVSGCQRNAIAQISAVNGTVRVSSCSLIVSGAVTANDLVIGGYGTVLTVYGGTAVRNRLMLDSPAKIVLRGESRLNDIRSDRNTNVLQFSRLKGDKPSLTMSGNVTGAGVTFCLEPLYYAAFDKPAETLTAKPDGAAAAYLLPYTDGVTQALPENRLLFKAPELEMSKFTYQESESSGLSLYKANGGYYASADEAMARYAVTMSGTTYLDMNQAVQRINEIGDIGKTYTIAFRQDLKDTNRTDKNDCSALPTARDNAAAQVHYSSQGGNHGLYFSGSPVLYAGAAEDREDEIRFINVYLRPSEVKYAGGEPVPAADGTVTIQIRRNSRSKAHVMLNLLMSNVEGAALKAITGVRGVTELDLNLKNYVKEMVITDGITNFDQVSVAQYNRICMNKISNVGSLKLGRLSRLIVTGTGSVDQIVVDSGTDNHPTLCVSFTQKGSGNNITRKPNFTVNGEIRAANRKLLVIEPLRSVFVNDDGIAEAISPLNYLRTETITDEYDNTSEVPIGRRNYTVTGTDQMGLPLINAKQANPEWITIDWNGLDERYLAGGIPQRSLGNAPDGVTPYKDMNGDILMTKTSDMPITITGFAADENDEKTFTAKVHTWEEAVKLIDARASGKDRYEVSFNPGEYGMGKGGAVSAMLWPKAANADHVELLDGDATDDDQPVLNYTGALNPACSVRFTQVCLCEYSNATTVSQTNSINTSNAVCIGFDHAMTQDPESGYLEFDKVTAKKGTIRLDKTLLISYGTVDVAAMELCSAGNEYAMLTTDYAPAVSDIKVSAVTVYGVAGFYGNGKITLGTIRGGSMESGGWTPATGEPVSGTDWEDVLWVDATFSAVKPENSVSQLTISGRVEGVTLAVHPYLYDWDAKKYGDEPTLQEMRERGLIYTGDANKAPAKGTQLLNAPYLNLTDLLVKTSTPDPEDPTTDFYLYGYGYADDYEVDADHPGEWLTWYKGSVYVTDLPATVDVEDTDEENCKYYPGWNGRMDENSTRFTNWEQAVAYVDKAAREDHSYEMCLRDDVGVISWRTVEERGVVKGREPAAVAKTFVMPKTKLADSLTIKTADDHPVCGFHSSATSLTVNGDVVLEDIGLNSLKVNKDSVTMQDLNFMVSAGSRLCLRGEITGSRIGNITGTATSGLSVEMKGNLAVNGGIRAFESVVLNGCDAYVNGEVNMKDLEMSGAELHAANITATGLTELSYGHGWNPEDRNYSIHRPSTLAADMDEAAGKGVVTLNNVNSAVGMSLLGGRFEGNNIVSKLGVRGQSQLTIKGTVSHWLMGEEQDGGSSLCISFLYGRGNETYAVLLRDQVLVNCVNTAQAEGVAHRVCLGYASSDPNEWRGNEGKVSGISDPVLTVPAKGKTVIVTGP